MNTAATSAGAGTTKTNTRTTNVIATEDELADLKELRMTPTDLIDRVVIDRAINGQPTRRLTNGELWHMTGLLTARGRSANEIAEAANVTQRHVYRVRRQYGVKAES